MPGQSEHVLPDPHRRIWAMSGSRPDSGRADCLTALSSQEGRGTVFRRRQKSVWPATATYPSRRWAVIPQIGVHPLSILKVRPLEDVRVLCLNDETVVTELLDLLDS